MMQMADETVAGLNRPHVVDAEAVKFISREPFVAFIGSKESSSEKHERSATSTTQSVKLS